MATYDDVVALLTQQIDKAQEARGRIDAHLKSLHAQLELVQRAHRISQTVETPVMMLARPPPQGETHEETWRLSPLWRDLLVEMAGSQNGFQTECSATGLVKYFGKKSIPDMTMKKVRTQLSRLARSGYLNRVSRGRYTFGQKGIDLVQQHQEAASAASS